MEKKDNPLYLEKYSFIRFGPSVKQFGGKPSEGVIAITTAGMVCKVMNLISFICSIYALYIKFVCLLNVKHETMNFVDFKC